MKAIGLTDQEMRSIFEAQVYRQKMVEYKTKDLKPEEDEVWARHILVPDAVSAQAVLDRLNKGEDFGKVASEVSLIPVTRIRVVISMVPAKCYGDRIRG